MPALSNRCFVFGFLAASLVLLALTHLATAAIAIVPAASPKRLSILDFATLRSQLVARDSSLGRRILDAAYGPYAGALGSSAVDLSPREIAEFTMPIVMIDSRTLGVRESPLLRYWLWREHAPDVVLMGSSMMFMNVSRQTFFELFPDRRLIDFTMGDNTPEVTRILIDRLKLEGGSFQHGVLVIYGLNAAELIASYNRAHGYVHLRRALAERDEPAYRPLLRLIAFGRTRLTASMLTRAAVERLGLAEPKKPIVPPDVLADPVRLRTFVMRGEQLTPTTAQSASPIRVQALRSIADQVQRAGATFVLVRLPTSHPNANRVAIHFGVTTEALHSLRRQGPLTIVDASDLATAGLEDRDYVHPGRRFDPEHLNTAGARKFTRFLAHRVIERHFSGDPIPGDGPPEPESANSASSNAASGWGSREPPVPP